MAQNTLLILVLLVLAFSAMDSIMGLAWRNGWLIQNRKYVEAQPRYLPGTSVAMISKFTGIKALDEFLVQLLVSFWPVGSGESPVLSTFAVYMAGQCLATHTLVALEGTRAGNKGKFISRSTFWGTVYQSVPWGIIKPLYWALHLGTSPLAQNSSQKVSDIIKMTSPNPPQVTVLPIALVLGFILPTILAGLPTPSIITLDQKQILLVVWQFWPLYVGGFQLLLGLFVSSSPTSTPSARLRQLRRAYAVSLVITAGIHLFIITFTVAPALQQSLISFTDHGITVRSVFVPQSPLSTEKIVAFAEGVLTLLKYDMYYACAATLLWATTISRNSRKTSIKKTLGEVLFFNMLCGPGGAALALVWLRDERVLALEKSKEYRR